MGRKHITALLIIPIFLMLVTLQSFAESPAELQASGESIWCQTYKAYGRTIDVNRPIEMPDVQKAPVLVVELTGPDSDAFRDMKKQIEKDAADDKYNNLYEANYNADSFTCGITKMYPRDCGKMLKGKKSSLNEMNISWKCHRLKDYDTNSAYADNNTLTVADACDTLLSTAQTLYPGSEYTLRYVGLTDRSMKKSDKTPLQEKGCYNIEFVQNLAGLDLIDSYPFRQGLAFSDNDQDAANAEFAENFAFKSGTMHGQVYGKDEFDIYIRNYKIAGTIRDNVPLVSFDTIKPQVENLINAGKIRLVDKIQLGYISFSGADVNERVLVPCWVVWCVYSQDPAWEEDTTNLWDELGGYYKNSGSFIPLAFNAETGEIIDPESVDIHRSLPPEQYQQ